MSSIIDFFSRQSPQDEFEALMRPHLGHLYRVAYRFTKNQHGAEDLVQDLMVHLYPKLEEIKLIENLKPWLARSIYNRFIDNLRKDKRNPVADAVEDSVLETMTDQQPEPTHELEQDLMTERLNQALETLNEDQRYVVMLHDMEGYTLTELADILSTPVGTLKSRLHRARNSIKKALAMEPSDSLLRVKG